MTSLKQIEANRRNALKSTGPRSEAGKERSLPLKGKTPSWRSASCALLVSITARLNG
jgi:hypothetical protein